MAEFAVPGWLQNAGAVHSAEQMRNYVLTLPINGRQSASPNMQTRGGVGWQGDRLFITQTGSPSMAVLVHTGECVIPGTEGSKQGGYGLGNDADITLSIAASHATLHRIDIVIARIRDTQYSGGVNSGVFEVVTGTPASSPVAPALPANSLLLAEVSIVALDTQITNAEITDKRTFLAGLGGIINCTSTRRPAAGTVEEGQLIYEEDTNAYYETTDGGTTWLKIFSNAQWTSFVGGSPAWTSTGTAPAIGNGSLTMNHKWIGRTIHLFWRLIWGSTTTGGTGTWLFNMPVDSNNSDIALYGYANDNSATLDYPITGHRSAASIIRCGAHTSAGAIGAITATHPFTWATNDILVLSCTYQAVSDSTYP